MITKFSYFVDREFREERLSFLVRHGGMHDHVFSLLPVDGSSNPMLVTDLERCGR